MKKPPVRMAKYLIGAGWYRMFTRNRGWNL